MEESRALKYACIVSIIFLFGLIPFIYFRDQSRIRTAFTHKCRLLEREIKYSRYSEHRITVWDAGQYGTLVSEDDHVFRWAKDKSILILNKFDNDSAYILGIKIQGEVNCHVSNR